MYFFNTSGVLIRYQPGIFTIPGGYHRNSCLVFGEFLPGSSLIPGWYFNNTSKLFLKGVKEW